MEFKLERFNPRRAARRAPAAEVLVTEDDGRQIWLWMSVTDLRNNIKEFGPNQELTNALVHYKTRAPFPPDE